MKKSAKDNEIEKLKKQVKKLKEDKKALKKEMKSLSARLATSKKKSKGYHDALKKKDAARQAAPKNIHLSDEPIRRHQYSILVVSLAVAFYSRLSVGSRQVAEIFNILNEFTGDMFGDVPAYTTIAYWAKELGLNVYKESCRLFKGRRYALVVDESMMIGSEKLLLTLATDADHKGHAITEKDIVVVDISIAKSWNGESIKKVLEGVAERIGHNPEYVVSDNGSTIRKAVRDANFKHHLDISHSLGMFLERVYKKEDDFQKFSDEVSKARQKYNMQGVAFVQPPSQRSIARFMNMSKWIEWASRMKCVYSSFQDDIKEAYDFIPENAALIDELSETMACITKIERDIKTNGISHESAARCKKLVAESIMNGNERQRKVGTYILDYMDKEVSLMSSGERHNASSDTIESTFGVIKMNMSDDKLVGVSTMILVIPLRLKLADRESRANFNFKERLEQEKYRHIKEWADENLSPNLTVKRINTLGKKSA